MPVYYGKKMLRYLAGDAHDRDYCVCCPSCASQQTQVIDVDAAVGSVTITFECSICPKQFSLGIKQQRNGRNTIEVHSNVAHNPKE